MPVNHIIRLCIVILFFNCFGAGAQNARHTFTMGKSEFLLDGKPFQVISGELHPARIPHEYWRHRIKMVKAMGCNTIASYIFWSFHEPGEGQFDFSTDNHNLREFIKIVQEEGMWFILRPGPYVCAEWDMGGIPPYLLKIPDIKLRCMDPRYMVAAERYMKRLAEEVKPFLITKGGPVILLQIENEYGSYANDRSYMFRLREIWKDNGMDIPTFTADGPTQFMLEAGSLPGSAVGINPGPAQKYYDFASGMNPGVPVFSSETYPGWPSLWGGEWQKPDTSELYAEIKFLMDNKKSFNIYVIHGGTSFGFTSGANAVDKPYEPEVTSYDYDAPINEQGLPTHKYMALRKLIGSYLPKGQKLPIIPDPVPAIEVPPVKMEQYTSVWDNLPVPVKSVQPLPMESYGQYNGLILYRTNLVGHKKGNLLVTDLHDYATVFLNDEYIGNLNRMEGRNYIQLPENKAKLPALEILTEGMGRIDYGEKLIDRKGITERVSLNGITMMNWDVFNLPMDDQYIANLKKTEGSINKPGIFFKGTFNIERRGDTYIDFTSYTKGIMWVNGHNLGRYWNIGPQKRLYCPAEWLKPGLNEILIFDIHQTEAKNVEGFKVLE